MKLKRIVVAGTITALLMGLAGTGSALVWMHGKVRALEQERAQLAQKVEEAASATPRRQAVKPPWPRKDKGTSARRNPGFCPLTTPATGTLTERE